jgi:hypothetical protein
MIYIQVLDRYWQPGLKMLQDLDDRTVRTFQEFLAEEYVRLCKLSIDEQRYIQHWKSLTPGYSEYKKKHGLSPLIWEATGQVRNSLKVFHRGGVIIIGYDKRVNHIGTHTKVYQIAKWMEYGNLRIPPRPLFRSVYVYMSSNIDYFWKKYLFGGYYDESRSLR